MTSSILERLKDQKEVKENKHGAISEFYQEADKIRQESDQEPSKEQIKKYKKLIDDITNYLTTSPLTNDISKQLEILRNRLTAELKELEDLLITLTARQQNLWVTGGSTSSPS